jgi:hypothetical protein
MRYQTGQKVKLRPHLVKILRNLDYKPREYFQVHEKPMAFNIIGKVIERRRGWYTVDFRKWGIIVCLKACDLMV